MAFDNSTALFPGFPEPPDGANPYLFDLGVLVDSLSVQVGAGFVVRQSILCALSAYVVFIAIANLVMVVRDGRERGKRLFLWRRVGRERGRYIVGNRQLLEPILTLVLMPFLLAHVIIEWRTTFGTGYARSTGLMRIMPWTVLFIQLWIVTWASLQSYVITASDTNRLIRWLSPRVANWLFVGFGAVMLIMLTVADIYGTRASLHLGRALDQVRVLLATAAGFWPGDVPVDLLDELRRQWARVVVLNKETEIANRGTMATFVIAPFLTLIVNAGCIALLSLVHRQIKENYGTLANLQLANITPVFPVKGDEGPLHVIEFGAVDPPASTTAVPDAGVAFSITPATPPRPDAAAFSDSCQANVDPASQSPVDPPSPAGSTQSSTSRGKELRPTRSVIRRLANRDDGDIVAVKARNLQVLQRAEMDLFITGLSGIALTVSFAGLSLWTLLTLTARSHDDSPGGEIVLLLGSWLYAFIQSCSLTAHFRSMYLNAQPPPASAGAQDAREPGSPQSQSLGGTSMSMSAGHNSTIPDTTSVGSIIYMPTLESQSTRVAGEGMRRMEEARIDPMWLSPADAAVRDSTKGEEEEEDGDRRDVIIEMGEVDEPVNLSPLPPERDTSAPL
ncbi:hypothetical protein JCM3770_005028 [Rhodotorula araucariae]